MSLKRKTAKKFGRLEKNNSKICTFAPSYIKANGKEETKETAGAAISIARAVYQAKGTDVGNRDVLCER